jgi:hypothetical protein
MRASGDGLDVAATFPEGQQLDAERAAPLTIGHHFPVSAF